MSKLPVYAVAVQGRPEVAVAALGRPAVASVTVPGQQGARGIQGPQGEPGAYGSVRYGEMMGIPVTDLPAGEDMPFIVTAPRDVINDLRGPFEGFDFLDANGILRARKSGDTYLLSLRFTVIPQVSGGWIQIAVYIAGNISGTVGPTSERTVALTKSAGSPHRVDELLQVFPRAGFLTNGAVIMLHASVPVQLSAETLFVTPLVAAP